MRSGIQGCCPVSMCTHTYEHTHTKILNTKKLQGNYFLEPYLGVTNMVREREQIHCRPEFRGGGETLYVTNRLSEQLLKD